MSLAQFSEKSAVSVGVNLHQNRSSDQGARAIPMASALGNLDHEIAELGNCLDLLVQRIGNVMEPTGPAPVAGDRSGVQSDAQLVVAVTNSAHRVRLHREVVEDVLRRLAI